MSIPLHAVPASATGALWEHDPTGDPQDPELFEAVFNCGVPLLQHLVLLARGWQIGSPWGLLGMALGVAACDAPDVSVVSGTGSRPVPLNILVSLTAPPGGGKGQTASAPLVTATPRLNEAAMKRPAPPASGEMLVQSFYDEVVDEAGKRTGWQQTSAPLFFVWNEIDVLAAKSGAKGNTLDPALRSMFTGEDVGDASATRKAQGVPCLLEAGTYRAVGIIGAQLRRAAPLLNSSAGGLLQRLLWMYVMDDNALVDDADIDRAQQELMLRLGHNWMPYMSPPLLTVNGPVSGAIFDPAIMSEIRAYRGLSMRGETDNENDAHRQNLRIRLSAIHAGWRTPHSAAPVVIDHASWMWADAVLEHSTRLLSRVKGEVDRTVKGEARQRGQQWAESQTVKDEILTARKEGEAEREITSLMARTAKYLAMEPTSQLERRDLTTRLGSKPKTRAYRAAAWDEGADRGYWEVVSDAGAGGATAYRLTPLGAATFPQS